MTKNDVRTILAAQTDETTYEYEKELTICALQHDAGELETILTDIIKSNQEEEIIRYNAFVCLCTVYRSHRSFNKLLKLLDKYSDDFKSHITFRHFKDLSIYESGAIFDYEEMLKNALEDSLTVQNQAGFQHMIANLFVTIAEKEVMANNQAFIKKWYNIAKDACENAISLNPKAARFYCTKGRLLALKGQYRSALGYIDKAIGLEDKQRTDFSIRYSQYNLYKTMIMTNEKISNLEMKAGQVVNKMYSALEDFRFDQIENDLNTSKDKQQAENFEGKPYAFISYSTKNHKKLSSLLNLLNRNKIRYWYAEKILNNGIEKINCGIPNGVDYDDYIANKIIGCSLVLYLVSSDSAESEYVRKELIFAREKKKPIIQIYTEDVPLPPGMDLQFAHIQSPRIREYNLSDNEYNDRIMEHIPEECFYGQDD